MVKGSRGLRDWITQISNAPTQAARDSIVYERVRRLNTYFQNGTVAPYKMRHALLKLCYAKLLGYRCVSPEALHAAATLVQQSGMKYKCTGYLAVSLLTEDNEATKYRRLVTNALFSELRGAGTLQRGLALQFLANHGDATIIAPLLPLIVTSLCSHREPVSNRVRAAAALTRHLRLAPPTAVAPVSTTSAEDVLIDLFAHQPGASDGDTPLAPAQPTPATLLADAAAAIDAAAEGLPMPPPASAPLAPVADIVLAVAAAPRDAPPWVTALPGMLAGTADRISAADGADVNSAQLASALTVLILEVQRRLPGTLPTDAVADASLRLLRALARVDALAPVAATYAAHAAYMERLMRAGEVFASTANWEHGIGIDGFAQISSTASFTTPPSVAAMTSEPMDPSPVPAECVYHGFPLPILHMTALQLLGSVSPLLSDPQLAAAREVVLPLLRGEGSAAGAADGLALAMRSQVRSCELQRQAAAAPADPAADGLGDVANLALAAGTDAAGGRRAVGWTAVPASRYPPDHHFYAVRLGVFSEAARLCLATPRLVPAEAAVGLAHRLNTIGSCHGRKEYHVAQTISANSQAAPATRNIGFPLAAWLEAVLTYQQPPPNVKFDAGPVPAAIKNRPRPAPAAAPRRAPPTSAGDTIAEPAPLRPPPPAFDPTPCALAAEPRAAAPDPVEEYVAAVKVELRESARCVGECVAQLADRQLAAFIVHVASVPAVQGEESKETTTKTGGLIDRCSQPAPLPGEDWEDDQDETSPASASATAAPAAVASTTTALQTFEARATDPVIRQSTVEYALQIIENIEAFPAAHRERVFLRLVRGISYALVSPLPVHADPARDEKFRYQTSLSLLELVHTRAPTSLSWALATIRTLALPTATTADWELPAERISASNSMPLKLLVLRLALRASGLLAVAGVCPGNDPRTLAPPAPVPTLVARARAHPLLVFAIWLLGKYCRLLNVAPSGPPDINEHLSAETPLVGPAGEGLLSHPQYLTPEQRIAIIHTAYRIGLADGAHAAPGRGAGRGDTVCGIQLRRECVFAMGALATIRHFRYAPPHPPEDAGTVAADLTLTHAQLSGVHEWLQIVAETDRDAEVAEAAHLRAAAVDLGLTGVLTGEEFRRMCAPPVRTAAAADPAPATNDFKRTAALQRLLELEQAPPPSTISARVTYEELAARDSLAASVLSPGWRAELAKQVADADTGAYAAALDCSRQTLIPPPQVRANDVRGSFTALKALRSAGSFHPSRPHARPPPLDIDPAATAASAVGGHLPEHLGGVSLAELLGCTVVSAPSALDDLLGPAVSVTAPAAAAPTPRLAHLDAVELARRALCCTVRAMYGPEQAEEAAEVSVGSEEELESGASERDFSESGSDLVVEGEQTAVYSPENHVDDSFSAETFNVVEFAELETPLYLTPAQPLKPESCLLVTPEDNVGLTIECVPVLSTCSNDLCGVIDYTLTITSQTPVFPFSVLSTARPDSYAAVHTLVKTVSPIPTSIQAGVPTQVTLRAVVPHLPPLPPVAPAAGGDLQVTLVVGAEQLALPLPGSRVCFGRPGCGALPAEVPVAATLSSDGWRSGCLPLGDVTLPCDRTATLQQREHVASLCAEGLPPSPASAAVAAPGEPLWLRPGQEGVRVFAGAGAGGAVAELVAMVGVAAAPAWDAFAGCEGEATASEAEHEAEEAHPVVVEHKLEAEHELAVEPEAEVEPEVEPEADRGWVEVAEVVDPGFVVEEPQDPGFVIEENNDPGFVVVPTVVQEHAIDECNSVSDLPVVQKEEYSYYDISDQAPEVPLEQWWYE